MGRDVSQTETCESIWDTLSAYVDGMASPAEAERVERHVEGCALCARDLAFMRGTATALGSLPEIAPPAHLRESILAATLHKPRWYQRLTIGVPVRSLAVAGALAALLGIVILGRRPAPPVSVAVAPPAEIVLPSPPPFRTDSGAQSLVKALPATTPKVAEVSPEPPIPAVKLPDAQIQVSQVVSPAVIVKPLPLPSSPVRRPGTSHARSAATKGAGSKTAVPEKPKADLTPDSGEDTPEPMMPETMAPTGPMVASDPGHKGELRPDPIPAPAPPTAANRVTIHVASASETLSPSSVATLADLRKQLSAPTDHPFVSPGLFRSNEHRDVRVDIYKTRF